MSSKVKFVLSLEFEDDGSYTSSLKCMTSEDLEALRAIPSGGLTQVPHALFVETLRREAYTTVISLMSNGASADSLTVTDVDREVRAYLLNMMDRFSKYACEDALHLVQPKPVD